MSDIEVIEVGQASQHAVLAYDTPDPLDGAVVVSVDPGGTPTGPSTTLVDLADVDVADAPTDVPLVWRRHPDGVWRPELPVAAPATWSTPLVLSEAAPDAATAPVDAVWVRLGPDMTIYRRSA